MTEVYPPILKVVNFHFVEYLLIILILTKTRILDKCISFYTFIIKTQKHREKIKS